MAEVRWTPQAADDLTAIEIPNTTFHTEQVRLHYPPSVRPLSGHVSFRIRAISHLRSRDWNHISELFACTPGLRWPGPVPNGWRRSLRKRPPCPRARVDLLQDTS